MNPFVLSVMRAFKGKLPAPPKEEDKPEAERLAGDAERAKPRAGGRT